MKSVSPTNIELSAYRTDALCLQREYMDDVTAAEEAYRYVKKVRKHGLEARVVTVKIKKYAVEEEVEFKGLNMKMILAPKK